MDCVLPGSTEGHSVQFSHPVTTLRLQSPKNITTALCRETPCFCIRNVLPMIPRGSSQIGMGLLPTPPLPWVAHHKAPFRAPLALAPGMAKADCLEAANPSSPIALGARLQISIALCTANQVSRLEATEKGRQHMGNLLRPYLKEQKTTQVKDETQPLSSIPHWCWLNFRMLWNLNVFSVGFAIWGQMCQNVLGHRV